MVGHVSSSGSLVHPLLGILQPHNLRGPDGLGKKWGISTLSQAAAQGVPLENEIYIYVHLYVVIYIFLLASMCNAGMHLRPCTIIGQLGFTQDVVHHS